MTYRDDLEALAHRVKALEADVTSNTRDLTDARRVLDDARRRGKLPVLDNIRIAAPCHAEWDDMKGDDRARFCGSCEKNVYNLSAMTRVEAETLLIAKEGKLCVRYYQRADGTILTNDCEVGVAKRRRKIRIVAAAFGAMSAVAAAASVLRPHPPMTMGEIAMVPPTVAIPVPLVPDMIQGQPAMPMMGVVTPPPPPLMGKISIGHVKPPKVAPVRKLMGTSAYPGPEMKGEPLMGDVAPVQGRVATVSK